MVSTSARPLEHKEWNQQRVTPVDPPLQYSGDALLYVDTEGRLRRLEVLAPQEIAADAGRRDVDWSVLFKAAGLEIENWRAIEPRWNPLHYGDARASWEGTLPPFEVPTRIEAAAYRGVPVWFDIGSALYETVTGAAQRDVSDGAGNIRCAGPGYLFFLFVLRILLRNTWLAGAVAALVLTPVLSERMLAASEPWIFLPFALAGNIVLFSVLIRFGFLALAVLAYVSGVLTSFPLTFEASSWYAGFGYAVLGIVAGLALFGFKTSLGGRRLFEFSDA